MIQLYHTSQALNELLQRDFEGACQKLLGAPNAHPYLRPYQREANSAAEKAISERKRQMLLAMATAGELCRLPDYAAKIPDVITLVRYSR